MSLLLEKTEAFYKRNILFNILINLDHWTFGVYDENLNLEFVDKDDKLIGIVPRVDAVKVQVKWYDKMVETALVAPDRLRIKFLDVTLKEVEE